MSYTPPISDDKWDSWEPLVAGVPFFLRLIMLQYAIVLPIVLAVGFGAYAAVWSRSFPVEPVSFKAIHAVLIASGLALFGVLLCCLEQAGKAKRWAVGLLGICSYGTTIACLVLLLTIPAYVRTSFGVFQVDLPLEVCSALTAIGGIYLFRLRARLKRLGLP